MRNGNWLFAAISRSFNQLIACDFDRCASDFTGNLLIDNIVLCGDGLACIEQAVAVVLLAGDVNSSLFELAIGIGQRQTSGGNCATKGTIVSEGAGHAPFDDFQNAVACDSGGNGGFADFGNCLVFRWICFRRRQGGCRAFVVMDSDASNKG